MKITKDQFEALVKAEREQDMNAGHVPALTRSEVCERWGIDNATCARILSQLGIECWKEGRDACYSLSDIKIVERASKVIAKHHYCECCHCYDYLDY